MFQGVFLFSVIQYKPPTYLGYEYPWWGDMIGWFMALSSILVMPGYAIYKFAITPGTFREVSNGEIDGWINVMLTIYLS